MTKKVVSNWINPKCCTAQKLTKFRKRAESALREAPGETNRNSNGYHAAICDLLSLSEYCGCMIIVILEIINTRDLWRWALLSGRLSVEQTRYVGEMDYMDWFNLFGTVEKMTNPLPIFSKPYRRGAVLDYMRQVTDHEVIAAGIETMSLKYHDIKKILDSGDVCLKNYGVQRAIIQTRLLSQDEVIVLLRHYDGSCFNLAVGEYFQSYQPKSTSLEAFLDAVVKIDGKQTGKIYEQALKMPNHGLSSEYIVSLMTKGYLNLSARSASIGSSCNESSIFETD